LPSGTYFDLHCLPRPGPERITNPIIKCQLPAVVSAPSSRVANVGDDKVAACLADVLADLERQGGIDGDDVNRLIDGHRLSGDESVRLLAELARLKVQFDEPSDESIDETTAETADAVGQVLRASRQFPLLRAEEEVALGRRISIGQLVEKTEPDPLPGSTAAQRIADGRAARERLVLSNTRLVVSIARRYPTGGMELSDLIQEGIIGLMRAADKYDHSLGYKFSTYATWWIRQAITRGMADRGRLIRLPVHFAEQVNRISAARGRLERSLGREPSLLELARELAMEPADVQGILDCDRVPISLDTPIGDGDSDLGDFLGLYSADVGEQVERTFQASYVDQTLDELALHLRSTAKGATAHAADMVRLRFGFEDDREWTLEEIGDRYGITRERVRQIINKTLASPLLVRPLLDLHSEASVK
jgi:RNA polymerase primary sigma factor